MRDQLILLPGWAFGPAALQPLCEALVELAPSLDVVVEPLPELSAAHAWLDELDQRLPRDSWLAGWSLGGMLASQLAARRVDSCRGLITIASNPCFRARPQWPEAMGADIFDAFHEAFRLDPEETLKRFRLLCSRGGYDPRTLARQLEVSQSQSSSQVLDAGLQLLAELDGRGALHGYFGPQLHLFAGNDALVPAAACEALRRWMPGIKAELITGASHTVALERADDVAAAMVAFIKGALA
ncbi:alpha/beta fold hydrolase [Pseudomonas sp. KSR10]|jgi:pimeloyl-[acyl-carrier protein] methyl ester esterase|uniref:Transporter n=1 Tax=Stutzerimonas stutzeri TaxID=316 RepID=A0A0D9AF65_STUST|nr:MULTISPECIES: alpha/beta fold hydrolase [Pseudomonadaceae]KJH79379.1 transporter [Stutzerimonas stutzeri]MCG6540980.1 alpha/beta fold hydrolase [Pseudomonas sp. KSR10]